MYLSALATTVPAALLLAFSGSATASPQSHAKNLNPGAFAEQAASALQHNARPGRGIPPQYVKQATCIAVFPNIRTKNGPVAGNGETRNLGLVECRDNNGKWASTAPVFVTLTGNLGGESSQRMAPSPEGLPGPGTQSVQRRHGPYGPLGRQLIVLFLSSGSTQALRNGAVEVGKLIATHAEAPGPTRVRVLAWRSTRRAGYSNVDISNTTLGFAKQENGRSYGHGTPPHALLTGNVPAGKMDSNLTPYTRALEQFAPASEYAGNNKINSYSTLHP